MAIILGIFLNNLDVLPKYLGALHLHMHEKLMFFKPKSVDEACVHAQYLENIGLKRAQSSESKQKEEQDSYKEGKKKLKGGKDKNKSVTTHQRKYPSNYHNHCNIDGHTKEKCWKFHLELNLKNKKKDNKKKNLMAND